MKGLASSALTTHGASGWAESPTTRAAIDLALGFHTWRSLTDESGLSTDRAAELMARIVRCAG